MQDKVQAQFLKQLRQQFVTPSPYKPHLLNSHHGLHVLRGIAQWDAGQAPIPVEEVVVDVAPDQPQHVAEVGLELGHNRGRNAGRSESDGIDLGKGKVNNTAVEALTSFNQYQCL